MTFLNGVKKDHKRVGGEGKMDGNNIDHNYTGNYTVHVT